MYSSSFVIDRSLVFINLVQNSAYIPLHLAAYTPVINQSQVSAGRRMLLIVGLEGKVHRGWWSTAVVHLGVLRVLTKCQRFFQLLIISVSFLFIFILRTFEFIQKVRSGNFRIGKKSVNFGTKILISFGKFPTFLIFCCFWIFLEQYLWITRRTEAPQGVLL